MLDLLSFLAELFLALPFSREWMHRTSWSYTFLSIGGQKCSKQTILSWGTAWGLREGVALMLRPKGYTGIAGRAVGRGSAWLGPEKSPEEAREGVWGQSVNSVQALGGFCPNKIGFKQGWDVGLQGRCWFLGDVYRLKRDWAGCED